MDITPNTLMAMATDHWARIDAWPKGTQHEMYFHALSNMAIVLDDFELAHDLAYLAGLSRWRSGLIGKGAAR